jgi:UDP-glucose 6-dehydrogenase
MNIAIAGTGYVGLSVMTQRNLHTQAANCW